MVVNTHVNDAGSIAGMERNWNDLSDVPHKSVRSQSELVGLGIRSEKYITLNALPIRHHFGGKAQ